MSRVRYGCLGICSTGLAALCAPALAADPMLEEVIVTAQKREQNLQETPISIAVLGTEDIERRGITNVADLAAIVPNLRIVPFGVSPTTLRLYVRGVGVVDSQVTQDPPVGIYLNSVYIARPVGLSLDIAELERVEVLRGPQGTLYGRNTTGGAINLITRKPTEDFGFSQLLSAGNYSAFRSQTSVNVPLGRRFFASAAFNIDKRDGWLKNIGAGEDFSEHDRKAGRIDLRWLASEAVTVDYSYDRSESDFTADYYHLLQAAPSGAFVPGLPVESGRRDSVRLAAPFHGGTDRAEGHTLTVSVQTPLGELRSISAYREAEQHAYNDYSGNPFVTVYRNDPFAMSQKQFSQELQLLGANGAGTIEYIAGLYYFDEEGEEVATDRFFDFPLPRRIAADNTSYAAYGQATWRPSREAPWSLTVGARYTEDERDGFNNIVAPVSRKDSNFAPSITVDYDLSETASVYGKIVAGYKAGGFNMRQADFRTSFGPEKLTAYELGWKTELLDRRMRFNGAVFYSDYRDIQLDILVPNQPDPTLTVTRNAGKAEVYGLETDVAFAATETLRLQLSYAYLGNDIKEVAGDDPNLWTLPNAPENSVTATLDWDLLKLPAGVLNLAVDTSWRDDSVTAARRRPGDDLPAYALTDVRLALSGDDWIGSGGRFTVAAWVRNAFDKEYFRDTFGSFIGVHAAQVATYGPPRTYGIDLSVRF